MVYEKWKDRLLNMPTIYLNRDGTDTTRTIVTSLFRHTNIFNVFVFAKTRVIFAATYDLRKFALMLIIFNLQLN